MNGLLEDGGRLTHGHVEIRVVLARGCVVGRIGVDALDASLLAPHALRQLACLVVEQRHVVLGAEVALQLELGAELATAGQLLVGRHERSGRRVHDVDEAGRYALGAHHLLALPALGQRIGQWWRLSGRSRRRRCRCRCRCRWWRT